MALYGTGRPLSRDQADPLTSGIIKVSIPSQTPSPDKLKYPHLYEDGRRTLESGSHTGRPACLCGLELDPSGTTRLPRVGAPKKGLSHLPTLPSTTSLGFDSPIIYSPMFHGFPIRTDRPSPLLPSGVIGQPLPLDPITVAPRYGLLNPRIEVGNSNFRKAATKETTGPLKAWLVKHKKNPYPTKAEKVMLAIISKMSLTQVSTWFANARRRLKKENKTYTPGTGGQDNNIEDGNAIDDNQGDNLHEMKDKKDAEVGHESDGRKSELSFTHDLTSVTCNIQEVNVGSSDTDGDELNFDWTRSKLGNHRPTTDSASGPHFRSSTHTTPQPPNSPPRLKTQCWSIFSLNSIYSHSSFASNIIPLAPSSDIVSSPSPGERYCPKTNPKEREGQGNSREAMRESTKDDLSDSKSTDDKRVTKSKIWSISEIIKNQPRKLSSETDKHYLDDDEEFPRHYRGLSPPTLFTSSNSHTPCSLSQYTLNSFFNYPTALTSLPTSTLLSPSESSLCKPMQFSTLANHVTGEDMTIHHNNTTNNESAFSSLSSSLDAEEFPRLLKCSAPHSNSFGKTSS